jgi:predicted Ser/Thr protein kinase
MKPGHGGQVTVGSEDSGRGNPSSTRIVKDAVELGLLTTQQINELLEERARSRAEGERPAPIGDVLLSRGYLTAAQLDSLVARRERPRNAAPATFGRYRIVREIGHGGMGFVYEAVDASLGRTVALKLMAPTPGIDPAADRLEEERFVREAQLAARLKHPNIVTIYESGVLEGRRYIAMERVEGKSFAAWRLDGAVPLPRQIAILRDVAQAVHAAHEQGVVHRDLKPQNILVSPDGRPSITDFGLAKMMDASSASLTSSSVVVGTPAYMSPEQAQGLKDIDRRTDVYSMGVILYEILTGAPPFQGDTAIALLVKAVKDPVEPPSRVSRTVDRTLESVCLKALVKDPEGRYPTAGAFAEDLSRWLDGKRFRVSRPADRRTWGWLVASLVAGAVTAAALLSRPGEGDLARAERRLREGRYEEALVLYGRAALRDGDDARVRAGRERALAKMKERQEGLPVEPPPEAAWAGAVNLLPRVDPQKDAVAGRWKREGDTVLVEGGRPARLRVPYEPPREYDVRLMFTRRAGEHCVSLILTREGRSFILVLEPRGWFGLERVGGEDYTRNPAFVRAAGPLERHRTYTAVVQVRDTGLQAYLDGQPICRWKTDYSDLSMNPGWSLGDPPVLGLGCWDNSTLFHRLEVRELSGPGRATRP